MNILFVTKASLDDLEPWYLARALAEFGHLYIISVSHDNVQLPNDFPVLMEFALPHMRIQYSDVSACHISGATMGDCVRLAMTTPNWLPSIDLVVVGPEKEECIGAEVWLSDQTQAALLAHELGAPAFSFFQPEGVRQEWDGISYAAERLIRVLLGMPQLPRIVLHVHVPNVRPNEIEGFQVVSVGELPKRISRLDQTIEPWTFRKIPYHDSSRPGTDRWALEQRLVAVAPLCGWGPRNMTQELETVSLVSAVIARMGSSRAYRAAIDRALTHDVKYKYHFKGAVLRADPGFCTERSALPFTSDVDQVVERPILERVSGRVLDVGCGSGRIPIYLMLNHRDSVTEVVGVDSNPVALMDYERRWTQAISAPCITHCLDVRFDSFQSLGTFDAILLFGDTLGIGGHIDGVKKLLQELRAIIRPQGHLIVSGRDPLSTDNPDEQLLNAENVRNGFSPGERFLRITFEDHDSGWFPCYYATIEDLKLLALNTGWRLLEEHIYRRLPNYYGVILEPVLDNDTAVTFSAASN